MTATIARAPVPANDPRRLRWTRGEFLRLSEEGYFEGRRVMLIDGEVLAMAPMNSDHANGILFALQQLQLAFGSGFTVRPQLPLDLSQTTEPEPDIAVVVGSARSHSSTPTTAVMILEVADSSLSFDLGDKANLYAAAGIADYWVVDVARRRVHVHRDPIRDATRRFGHRYDTCTVHVAGESVSPLAAPHATVLVADLLP